MKTAVHFSSASEEWATPTGIGPGEFVCDAGGHVMETKMVLRDSDEAARLETITGWVARTGQFYGKDERGARWAGCTHEKCDGCGEIIPRGWCRTCRDKRDLDKWLAAERVPWDGTTPLYSDAHDKYFFDDDVEEFADDEGVELDDLRLYICVPQYGREIDSSYFEDELPEDGEVPDGIMEAMDALNKAIQDAGPLSWYPGKFVPVLPTKL